MAEGPAQVTAARRRPLDPRTWPVRWRLTAVSAGLTLAILLVFAGVVGSLVADRLRDDFDRELRTAVRTLVSEVRVSETPHGPEVTGIALDAFTLPNGAVVQIFDREGQLIYPAQDTPELGPPQRGIVDVGPMHVVTGRIVSASSGGVAGFIQYGRSDRQVDSTVKRMWLFIGFGVLGAVLLAGLAGLAIANRAMRPIADLTSTAHEIADTRDPSRHMPRSELDDEVGELARTLEQMLRSLDAARAERERAMQQQREFVADASHELRTPLTSVIANLELLQASLGEGRQGDKQEMVGSALRSSRRMSRLVSDLLLLARADAGRVSERTSTDLAEIAANAVAEVAPVAGSHRVALVNGEPLPLEGNPDELHRMVVNLLDNAIRHTPDGTTIDVHLAAEDGQAVIEVADDGPGIPAEMREQVFDRFVRGDGPADTAGGGGTGLGLAIVRAVARSHGGDVSAGTSQGGGASFRVTLPLHRTEQPVSASLGTV